MSTKGGDPNGRQAAETQAEGQGREPGRRRGALRPEDALYARLKVHHRAVDRACAIIRHALSTAGPWAVAFSGGKDSTCVFALVREQCPGTPAVFVDSGAEFPETLEFVESTPNVIRVAPTMTLLEMYRETGEFGAEARQPGAEWGVGQIKDVMMREPMAWAVREHGLAGIFSGLRAEESSARWRMGRYQRRVWRAASGTWRAEPIMGWTVADVWAFIAERELLNNPVYDRLAELGVPRERWRVAPYAGSTAIGFGRWAVLKRGWPDLFNRFAEEFPEARSYA